MHRFLSPFLVLFLLLLLGGCDGMKSLDAFVGGSAELSDKEESIIRLGASMEAGGDYKGAEQYYRKAIKLSNGSIVAHLALAEMYIKQGKDKDAAELLKKAADEQPDDPKLQLALGKLAVRQEKPKRALTHFSRGLEKTPDDLDLLNGKGVALDMLARHKEALLVYKKALKNAEGEEVLLVKNNMAMSHIMAGNYDKAIQILEKMEEIEQKPVLRQNLALAYGLKGDYPSARKWGGKDIDPKKLEENIRFYEQYRSNLLLSNIRPEPKPKKLPKRPQ